MQFAQCGVGIEIEDSGTMHESYTPFLSDFIQAPSGTEYTGQDKKARASSCRVSVYLSIPSSPSQPANCFRPTWSLCFYQSALCPKSQSQRNNSDLKLLRSDRLKASSRNSMPNNVVFMWTGAAKPGHN